MANINKFGYNDFTGSAKYSDKNKLILSGLLDRATWIFVGSDNDDNLGSVANGYRIGGDPDGVYYGNYFASISPPCQAAEANITNSYNFTSLSSWHNYKNWRLMESGQIKVRIWETGTGVSDYPSENEQLFPGSLDHVIVAKPVAVGGNGRVKPMYRGMEHGGEIGAPWRPEMWGGLGKLTWFQCTGGPGSYRYENNIEPQCAGTYVRYDIDLGYKDIEPVNSASITFLEDSYIISDRFHFNNYTPQPCEIMPDPFIKISAKCYFFGDSYINPSLFLSTLSFTPLSQNIIYSHKWVRILAFENDLKFYDSGFISGSKATVNQGSLAKNINNLDYDQSISIRPSSTSNVTKAFDNYVSGVVGPLRLRGNIEFFDGPREINISHFSRVNSVIFHDYTEYIGGHVHRAVFDGLSKTVNYKTIFNFNNGLSSPIYGYGPQISTSGSARFLGASESRWPLFCSGLFDENSTCSAPFFNHTIFSGDSTYKWTATWKPNSDTANNILTAVYQSGFYTEGLRFNLNDSGASGIFLGNSINFNSKVLTLGPTRFYESGKMLIYKRFSDVNGYLPSNYTGNFHPWTSSKNHIYIPIGSAGSDSVLYTNHNLQYCYQKHLKSGQRVALLTGQPIPTQMFDNGISSIMSGIKESSENEHVISCAPLVYAEFHDFENDGNWYNEKNWSRIGGRDFLFPDTDTVIKIMKGKHVRNSTTNGRKRNIQCGTLVIEDGAHSSVDILRAGTILNYGSLGGNINYVSNLVLAGTGSNTGIIDFADVLYYGDTATNYFDFTVGYIKPASMSSILPRRKTDDLGGEIIFPPGAQGEVTWDTVAGSTDLNLPISGSVFINRDHYSIGDFLYQTN